MRGFAALIASGGVGDVSSVTKDRAVRRIAKPLIRPSGTFSPPSRGEG